MQEAAPLSFDWAIGLENVKSRRSKYLTYVPTLYTNNLSEKRGCVSADKDVAFNQLSFCQNKTSRKVPSLVKHGTRWTLSRVTLHQDK